MRLLDSARPTWQSRAHFFAVSGRIMRRILVDWARSRQALKRGSNVPALELDEAIAVLGQPGADLVAIDDALQALAALDLRKSQIVELRFFGGLSAKETAEVLHVSEETVLRDWKLSKSWLRREMTKEPPVEDERWRRIEELYHSALERREGQRADFIRQACTGDRALQQEVESLLAQTEGDEDFLEAPALQVAAKSLAMSATTAGGSTAANPRSFPPVIGRYRIIQILGEGGMGIVYEAEQEHPRRRVALKVIKPGFGTPEQSRRFEHESMALGRLQHPGIAQIYEASTADTGFGRQPFFAMELIR